MQTLIGELLQRIIHKPVPGHTGQACKNPCTYANPKMRALTAAIGTCMPCMGCAFIVDLQKKGLQVSL